MKKTICVFLSILCGLFFLISCAAPESRVNESKVSELTSLPKADGYNLFSIGMLNDNTPIIILGTGKEDSLKKIYKVGFDGINKLIFEGEGRGSFYAIYVKSHSNNTYSIQFENDNALIFDTTTDQLIKTIDFSQVEGTFFSISNSGDRLLYSNASGLYVTDLDFQNENKIYTPKDLSTGARWPSFSNDDTKVAFSIGEPLTMQKCVYDFSAGKIITVNYNSYGTFWPQNLSGFISFDDGFVTDTPNNPNASIKYYDFDGNEISKININKIIYPMRTTKDFFTYYYDSQTVEKLTETGFRDCKIMLWNFKSGELKELDIGYQIQEIWSYQASKEGNKLLMFMTVVIDGKAIPKVLFVNLDD